jgi:small subunit ribosomal protein S6
MALYEHIFLARQDITTQQMEELIANFSQIIVDNGGKIHNHEYWGVKNLAYKIRKNRKAHYALLNIDAPHAAIAEMERMQSINEDVMRSLTIRLEKFEDGPSVMLQKRERDEKLAREFEFDRQDDDFGARAKKPGGGGRFRDAGGDDIEA